MSQAGTECVGSQAGASRPAPSTLPGALQKGAGTLSKLSTVTEVLSIKTYDEDETSPFNSGSQQSDHFQRASSPIDTASSVRSY